MSTIIAPQHVHGSWDLAGTPEADTLYGGKGSNRFEGGAGDDTVVYSGRFTQYAVSFDAASGSYRVGNDTLRDIEHLQFGDITLSIADALPQTGTQHQYSAGDDELIGSDLGYTLEGDWGNDRFTGNGGDDALYGGKGEDTALFHGNRADYDIVYDYTTSSYRVTDHTAGRDGADQLFDIERLKFADTTIQFEGIANNDVYDLSREPTAADLLQLDGVIGTPAAPLPEQEPPLIDGDLIVGIGYITVEDDMLYVDIDAEIELYATSVTLTGVAEAAGDLGSTMLSSL
ncbi:hypothetical protein [Aquabacterium sp.]|uniref:hypothetical protein n=1 Tax=Aquabacterium sp. TaxID=1872578 RepID=UPI002CF3CE00|nr:hypothetical protein [Aquabacterium sp.]HSW05562.1 hypothetical protein [Aquabacterium sp.]